MIHLIFEKADGSVVKGLAECVVQSPDEKQIVDSDLNHGAVIPGGVTPPQVVTVRTFSWQNNGDPNQPITDAGLFIDAYYATDPSYTPDSGKTYCGGSTSATFGDYDTAGGSHSAAADLATLLGWGDADTGGVQVSLDLGTTYTKFASGVGDSFSNVIPLVATAMDIGTVDGQLEPGDRATLYIKVQVPAVFSDPANAGVYLFNIGLFFNYTE